MTNGPRILVVDDEESLHAVMARVVARTGYEATYAHSGSEGLELALKVKPAVIVTDLRMPGMDGHTFLRRLAPLGLDAAIIVTSGTGEMDDVIDVLRHGAIDYLRKPWDPSELRTALARGVEVHNNRVAHKTGDFPTPSTTTTTTSTTTSVFQSLITRIQSGDILLPSLPAVIEKLRTLVAGKDGTLEAVTKLVSQDQALVTRVLQLGRSAMYASFKPTDLASTVACIGFQTLQALAETVWLNGCFRSRDPRFASYTDRLARFGVARAVAMRALARQTKLDPSAAYFAGLLADVGASFLIYLIAEKSPAESPETCLPFVRQHHTEIGAQLLTRWGHRPEAVELARHHHQSIDKRPSPYAKLHTLATIMASEMVGEDDLTDESPASSADAVRCARALGIDELSRQRIVKEATYELTMLLDPSQLLAKSRDVDSQPAKGSSKVRSI